MSKRENTNVLLLLPGEAATATVQRNEVVVMLTVAGVGFAVAVAGDREQMAALARQLRPLLDEMER